jgi:hypothetical protein
MTVALLTVSWGARAEPWNSGQGRELHGVAGPGEAVWFPLSGWETRDGIAFDKLRIDGGKLVGTIGGVERSLMNATVETLGPDGTTRLRYRVARINAPPTPPANSYPPVDPTGSTSYYTLINERTKKPYCRPTKLWFNDVAYRVDDSETGIQAVPVAEVWSLRGTQGRNPKHFTMACMAGAIAKCYRWGYQGWRSPAMKPYVQACTRMAMADYCGDGRSHTVEGTPIEMYDFAPAPVHRRPATATELADRFETAWTGGPAEPPELGGWRSETAGGGALCLSKKRWETIALRGGLGTCPPLADPRANVERWPDKNHPSQTTTYAGEYCDYENWAGVVDYGKLEQAGARLINTSSYLDALLAIWKRADGTPFTTSHLLDRGTRETWDGVPLPTQAVPPLVEAEARRYHRPPTALAAVFRTSDLPDSVLDGLGANVQLVPLRSYGLGPPSNRTRVTTTVVTPLGAGTANAMIEGWIYSCAARPEAAAKPLFRYQRTRGAPGYLTTTMPPGPAQSQGLRPATDDGWSITRLPGCPAGSEGSLPVLAHPEN